MWWVSLLAHLTHIYSAASHLNILTYHHSKMLRISRSLPGPGVFRSGKGRTRLPHQDEGLASEAGHFGQQCLVEETTQLGWMMRWHRGGGKAAKATAAKLATHIAASTSFINSSLPEFDIFPRSKPPGVISYATPRLNFEVSYILLGFLTMVWLVPPKLSYLWSKI
jgi:hypothetical protein